MKNTLRNLVTASGLFLSGCTYGQGTAKSFTDSANAFIKNYVSTHEVVTGKDRRFLHFFAPDVNYRVTARFEKINDPVGFGISTSQQSLQQYYRYGKISFTIDGKPCQLTVYQSKDLLQQPEYRDYLFIPFTDATTGKESYESGRYIDIKTGDIRDGSVVIDFNKAYNPYCCYTSGYSCPIPPKENTLSVAIRAGEQKYGKPVH